jgi:hypothetical protein
MKAKSRLRIECIIKFSQDVSFFLPFPLINKQIQVKNKRLDSNLK